MIDSPVEDMRDESAVVLLSGGQDSFTCLAWARRTFTQGVSTVSFDYGQRHKVELEVAAKLAADAGVPNLVLPMPLLASLGGAALTDDAVKVAEDAAGTGNAYAHEHGLPSTFVPGRNVLFLGAAAAYAARVGSRVIVAGVCEADDAGYPDCRASFVSDMEWALQSALDDHEFTIAAPLLRLDKARTFLLAELLGVLGTVIAETHTCYEGEHELANAWGFGCGECPACQTRAKGYDEYLKQYAGAAT